MLRDYYTILGVSPLASHAEIRQAYRKLAVKYHPDKNPDPSVADLFKEINEAYDVIGDPNKRKAYDYRRQNPFGDIFQQESQGKPHRDPAYRRRRQSRRTAPPETDPRFLMRKYLPYIRWTCWVGALITTLFFVDYVLPYHVTTEQVLFSDYIREGDYYVSRMATGKVINHDRPHNGRLRRGDKVRLAETPVFGSPMWIEKSDGSSRARALAYLYGPLIFFPIIIFVCSFLGIIFRKKIYFCFNLSVVSGTLLIIFWFLL